MSTVSVYVDSAFAVGDWGRWSGGGHLQADTVEELHAFAERLGLRLQWFQCKPGRPENDHYDLGRVGRKRAEGSARSTRTEPLGRAGVRRSRRARRESATVRSIV